MTLELLIVAIALALVAALYSSVGHGGASGYLAVMALAGFAPEELRPTALMLNIVVSSTATYRFRRHFRWRLFWPFVVSSLPAAFLAGRFIHLEAGLYGAMLGLVLFYAAWRLIASSTCKAAYGPRPPMLLVALVAGGGIGLISGTIGVGGGIFLSPLLILRGWAVPRAAAAIAAPFILLNSLAALIGFAQHHEGLPVEVDRIAVLAGTVFVAGLFGSALGANLLDHRLLNRLLAAVLVLAAAKMVMSAFG